MPSGSGRSHREQGQGPSLAEAVSLARRGERDAVGAELRALQAKRARADQCFQKAMGLALGVQGSL